jgi:hypothetical protein
VHFFVADEHAAHRTVNLCEVPFRHLLPDRHDARQAARQATEECVLSYGHSLSRREDAGSRSAFPLGAYLLHLLIFIPQSERNTAVPLRLHATLHCPRSIRFCVSRSRAAEVLSLRIQEIIYSQLRAWSLRGSAVSVVMTGCKESASELRASLMEQVLLPGPLVCSPSRRLTLQMRPSPPLGRGRHAINLESSLFILWLWYASLPTRMQRVSDIAGEW